MGKKILIFLLIVLALTACTQTQPPLSPILTITSTPSQTPITPPTITPTSIPPTSTLAPTPTSTPAPLKFNIKDYRRFSILRTHFESIYEYTGDRIFSVISSSFSPDGNAFALSACWGSLMNNGKCESQNDGFLIVVDANTDEIISDIPLDNAWPGNTAFSPDGNQLIVSTTYLKIFTWDLASNKTVQTFFSQEFNGPTRYPDVAVATDGSSLAAVINKTLYSWDFSGKLLFEKPVSQGTFSSGLNYSPDGSMLALFSEGRSGIDVIRALDGTLITYFPLDRIGGITFSPDGRFLAGFDYESKYVEVWNLETGAKESEISPEVIISGIVFSPDSELLILSGIKKKIENKDDYLKIAALYETRNWTFLDNLYSYVTEGVVNFSKDGTKMAIFQAPLFSIWGEPNNELITGFERLKAFQLALAQDRFEDAALMLILNEYNIEGLTERGLNINDIPGSLEILCNDRIIICYPVKDLVMMGNYWEYLAYLVRFEEPSGRIYESPTGEQIFEADLSPAANGLPVIVWPPGSY